MSQCTNRDLPAQAGRFLKQTLIARGITQEQFAEMVQNDYYIDYVQYVNYNVINNY